jgi:hypothetical protein
MFRGYVFAQPASRQLERLAGLINYVMECVCGKL